MYRLHKGKKWATPLIGLIFSILPCTISDIGFPYLGASILKIEIDWHFCLIEHPQIIIPSALVGIVLAYLKPITKCPHTAHVLISTSASLFYLLAFGVALWVPLLPFVFLILFIAVWIPCCASDIVFPLLFVD